MTCDKCRFWVSGSMDAPDLNERECRRNAPSVLFGHRFARLLSVISGKPVAEVDGLNNVDDMTDRAAEWPYTEADDWCGEFQVEPLYDV